MPYLDSGLPLQGSTPLTLHTSRQGAEHAEKRAPSQLLRMIRLLLDARDGFTDHELAARLEIPLASVCARRGQLREAHLVYAEGTRPGPDGTPNAIWRFLISRGTDAQ